MLVPWLWVLSDQWATRFHLYEASGNWIPEALISFSLETKQRGQQKNIYLHTEKSEKRNSISVLAGLLSHLWAWDYQTMPRLRDVEGVRSFTEARLSLRLSAHPSEAGNLLLHPENLKCKLNLDWENVFVTICVATSSGISPEGCLWWLVWYKRVNNEIKF